MLDDEGYNVRRVEEQFGESRIEVYKFYFRSLRSGHFLVLVAFLFIVSQFFAGGVDNFMSDWNTAYGKSI